MKTLNLFIYLGAVLTLSSCASRDPYAGLSHSAVTQAHYGTHQTAHHKNLNLEKVRNDCNHHYGNSKGLERESRVAKCINKRKVSVI